MVLAPLSPLLAALICLGLAAILTLLTLALVNFLSKAPVFGGWIADKATALEQTVSNALGKALSGIDSFIGGCIHSAARLIEHAGRAAEDTAIAALHVAESLLGINAAIHAVRVLAHLATKTLHGIEHGIRTLERAYHGIEHRVKVLERDLSKGIGHDLRLQIRALRKDLTHVENDVIPAIRTAENDAAAAIDNLYEWAKGKASLLGVGTFAYAVSVALSALGLNAIRCSNLGRMFNNRGCGLWNDLESLLGLFADTLLLTNICTILPWLETAVSDVADPLVVALTDVGAGLCSGGIGAAPTLQVPALSLPANPGVTLNLP